jgi:hypothetical protein
MMKKTMIAAIAVLSFAGAAYADAFSVNSLPLSGFTARTDNVETGSVAAKKVFRRTVVRDGAAVAQYYTLAKNGSAVVISEEAK